MRPFLLVGTVLLPWLASAQEPAVVRCATGETELLRKLNSACNSDFTNVPLQNWLASLAEQQGIQVWLNLPELDLVGADPSRPITVHFESIPLSQLLDRVLKPLQLEYVIRNGVLEITTPESASTHYYRRVYDIAPNTMPYSAEDIGELFSKSASRVHQERAAAPVVQLLSSRTDGDQTMHLYVFGNKTIHDEVQEILDLFQPNGP